MRLHNLPFKLESIFMRAGMRALKIRPTSYPFISGDSFRALANLIYEDGLLKRVAPEDASGISPLVFVQGAEVKEFLRNGCHKIDRPYVLMSSNGDENIDESYLHALDKSVIHWFAHNVLTRHPRLTCIPMGLENARLHYNGVIADFARLRTRLPVMRKIPRILCGFTVGNNIQERSAALHALNQSKVASSLERVNSREYRQRLAQFMFVASPPGNGFDCHRTWEALYLNVVPVVKRHPFFEQFPGLPLLQLDDWNDLQSFSEESLSREYEALQGKFGNLPVLWMDYWKNRIESFR